MTNNNVLYSNNARTQLSADITTSSTTLNVISTSLFPTITGTDFFYITLDNGTNVEIVKVISKSPTSFDCVRAQEGTSAFAFTSTTPVSNRLTAGNITNLARKTDRLADVATLATVPSPSVADGNSVLCAETDPNGVPLLALVAGSSWRFLNYPRQVYTGTVGAGATSTSINLTGATTLLPSSTTRAYVVQLTSGAYAGLCRFITVATNSFSWGAAFVGAPSSGDTYEVLGQVAQSDSEPIGIVKTYYGNVAPAGYVELNGGLASRTVFNLLYTHATTVGGGLVAEATWMTTAFTRFSVGDGSTTFRLPDFRGLALRGWDHGRGIDSGRGLGTYQEDTIQNITGSFGASSSDVTNLAAGTGAFSHDGPISDQWGADAKPGEAGYTFDASRVVRTSTETRPKSAAVMMIMKAGPSYLPAGPIEAVYTSPPPAFSISPTSATVSVTEAVAYASTLMSTGSPAGTISYSIASGSIGAGMNLSVSGSSLYLDGTPTTAGTYNSIITITLVSTGQTASFSLQVIVAAAPPPDDDAPGGEDGEDGDDDA